MNPSRLYQISEGTYKPGGFAFAGGFGPIADLWFLNRIFRERREAYWRVNPEKAGLSIEPNAKAWPDFIGNGCSPPLFFVSGRVVESLGSIGAPMGRVTEMPIAEIHAKSLRGKPVPKYYVIETIPGIEVDLLATGFKLDAVGNPVLSPAPDPWPSPYRYRLDSWNGTDLFAYRHFGKIEGPCIDMFCTERVKELAAKDGWTNVRFQPLALA